MKSTLRRARPASAAMTKGVWPYNVGISAGSAATSLVDPAIGQRDCDWSISLPR
ncbi:MAG: hypothetical protein ACHBNF_13545 [Chromatiales bacterium]